MPRGGKRPGAGRKKGSTGKDNRIKISVRLPEKLVKWLKLQPNQTEAVETAIKKLMEKEK